MKKTLGFIAFFLSLSIYFSCIDKGVDLPGDYQKVLDTELLAYAKKLVGENGEGCSLIDLQKGNPSSRAVTDYSTIATPLWEKAKTERHGDEEVLIVPLQSEQDIHFSMYFEEEHKERLYQTKAFSRLVIRSKDGYVMSQVLTYLPSRNYAKYRQEVLDTMGFSPLAVKYYGTILVSSLDGKFLQGFFYERGVPTIYIKEKKYSHTNASHSINDTIESDNHEHSHFINLRLTLTRNAAIASRSYGEGDEIVDSIYCPNCKSTDPENCLCKETEGKYENEYCEKCQWPKEDCICPSKCKFCGKSPCICAGMCVKCKEYPCICTPKKCEYCLKYYCNGECKNSKPEEPKDDVPEDEPEDEISPNAKELFNNSNMQREDWLNLENMLEEIKDDCLGGNLFNALKNLLYGSTMPIQFTDIISPNYASFDQIGGITLSRGAQSFHLLRAMMHAYRAQTFSTALYNSTQLNGEIEALYVQYLYASRLSGFRNSKWDKMYHSGITLEAVKRLEDILDDKGVLRNGKNNADLIVAVNLIATYLQKSSIYSTYTFDTSRTGLENFNNLNTLATGCQ